jgi:AraC-like DNA-binding protein
MSRRKTPIEVARASASAPTMKRMEADEEKVSPKLKRFVRYLRKNLFSQGLTVRKARLKTGNRDNSLSASFRRYLGKTPWRYIRLARLEVADVLLRDYAYTVGEVAEAVGYDNDETFSRNYEALTGDKPSAVIGEGSTPDIGIATLRRALRGELEPEEGLKVLARLRRLYEGRTALPPGFADGPEYERWKAEELWEEIRPLPFEKQRSVVRWHPFRTTALFDHLRRKSREEGRKDRQLGVRLAELALVSLDACGEASTDRFHDRLAEGLICLGNARRLAVDFPRSDADFEKARGVWRTPRSKPELGVAARIDLNQGTVRMFQRRYDEAREMLEKSLEVFEQECDSQGQIEALLQRAAIRGYTDDIEGSIEDLARALALVDKDVPSYLTFTIYKNLANAHARAGRRKRALSNFGLSREHLIQIDHPLGHAELKWLQGFIKEGAGQFREAESLYRQALDAFSEAGDSSSAALLMLDSAAVSSELDRHGTVLRLLSRAIPVLQSHHFHPETVTSLALVAKSLTAKKVSSSVVRELQSYLRQDPLTLLM